MSQARVLSEMSFHRPPQQGGSPWETEPGPFVVRSFGLTDPGRVRQSNEDQFIIAVLANAWQVQQTSLGQPKLLYSSDRGYLFAVADGMGGHAAGEKASALAIDFLESFVLDHLPGRFLHLTDTEHDLLSSEFRQALGQADQQIIAESRKNPDLLGMGTTMTLAYSYQDELHIVHVGDSRCYLIRDGNAQQLTADHTIAQEMVRKGILQAEDVADHPWRHVITNALGGNDPGVQVEAHKHKLQPGDQLLLCSDGLTDMLADAEIGTILQSESSPREACERLVTRANELGGRDNITVIVARYDEPSH